MKRHFKFISSQSGLQEISKINDSLIYKVDNIASNAHILQSFPTNRNKYFVNEQKTKKEINAELELFIFDYWFVSLLVCRRLRIQISVCRFSWVAKEN